MTVSTPRHSTDDNPDDMPNRTDQTETVYRVGTLVYTRRALVVLFFWMLFGDFCFTMMEGIVPSVVPLLLNDLPITKTTIALVIGVIPNLITMIVTPILSYRSDRHRGPWGRRIPYLVVFSPVVTACVILTGFSLDISAWIHGLLSTRFAGVSAAQIMFVTVATCSVLYQFFNLFVYYIYYYLFNDVIPQTLLGRYYALFRIVGAASGFLFSRYIFGWTEHHMRSVFVAIGLIYLVAFMLMCWKVREGQYPAPPPVSEPSTGRIRRWLAGLKTFVRDCYSHPFYWPLYIGYALGLVGGSGVSIFRSLFATEELGMSWDELGRAMSWGLIIGLVMYYPLGWLADRIHPMRLILIGIVATLLVYIGSAINIRSADTFIFWTLLNFASQAIAVSANAPLYPRIFPKSHFGQFSAAISLLSSGAVMLGNYAVGRLIDSSATCSYMVMYWWSVGFTVPSLLCYLIFYRNWKRRGGARNFVPPI